MFGINSSDKEEIEQASNKLYKILKKHGQEQMQIMPPLPAPIDKIKYRYRWRIIAKCKLSNSIIDLINATLKKYYDIKQKKANIVVDINPSSMI